MDIDIMRMAKLSRIEIDGAVAKKVEKNLNRVIQNIKDLPEFDENEKFFNPENVMQLRDDVVKDCGLDRDDMLKNAPQVKAGCVVVPKKLTRKENII